MHCISSYLFFFLYKIFFLTKTFAGVELFPTHLRSTAMAVTLVAARLGAILGNTVFGLFLEVQCAVPIIMVAALLVGQQPTLPGSHVIVICFVSAGGLLGLLLPNTTKQALE